MAPSLQELFSTHQMLRNMRLRLAQASVAARKAFSTPARSSAVISLLPLRSSRSRPSTSCSCTQVPTSQLCADNRSGPSHRP